MANNETQQQGSGTGGAGGTAGGTGGTSGGSSNVAPGATLGTPMFVRQLKEEKQVSTMFSPYTVSYFMNNPMDDKQGTAVFNKMTERNSDEARVAITVGSGTQFVDDTQHHFKMIGADLFFSIPTSGDGACLSDPKTNVHGTRIMNANLGDKRHLIKDFNRISFDNLKRTMMMVWGGTAATRTLPVTSDDMVIGTIDPNATGNPGLLDRWRQQMRIVSSLLYAYFKEHLTKDCLRSFLVKEEEMSFVNQESGQIQCDGFLLLHKILQISKPSVIVDVELMEKEMTSMTMENCGDDFEAYLTAVTDLKNKIDIAKGTTYVSDDKFLQTIFKGVSSATSEQFREKAKTYKDDWTVGDITDHNDVISKLSTLHKNMKNEGRWTENDSQSAKIVALVSKLQSLQSKVTKLQKGKSNTALATNDTSSKDGGKSRVGKDGSWQFAKEDEYKDHPVTGKKHVWCKHHGTGAYMPHPHNHDEWKKRKAEKKKSFTERRGKRVRFEEDKDKDRKGSGGKTPSKLQLGNSLRASLTTNFKMTAADADKVFQAAYDDASSSKD